MKKAILAVFAGALIATMLSFTHVLPRTSMMPPVLFAAAMILTLLNLIDASDRNA